jgi:hypothetical protein
VYLVTKDGDGFPVVEELGPSVEKVLQAADVGVFETLQSVIEPLLAREYQHIDKRQEVLLRMRSKIEQLGKTRPPTDPAFQELRVAMTKAKSVLGIQS